MAYATPAQMIQRYDVRTLGDLVGDNGIRVDRAALATDANLQAALDDASGEIEAALLQGKRYTTAQLTALTGNSAKYLVRLTCTIAFGLLFGRRPWSDDDEEGSGRRGAEKQARAALEMLRKGQTIFDVEEVKEAGLPAIETPTIQTILQSNLAVDQSRGHFYPRRRLPYYP